MSLTYYIQLSLEFHHRASLKKILTYLLQFKCIFHTIGNPQSGGF